ncbi:SEC-C domain-containing protein [bacterium]|nr:SEC-C domain-containing protein [bacterium]
MTPDRNDLCPCGSGKRYKRCCMDSVAKQYSEMFDNITQTVAMNPNLSLDELDLVAQQLNNQPHVDFCGLSPIQMDNWLYSPFNELKWVTISTPDDLSTSPVMRYLTIILDEAMGQDGSFKVTTKGNLPTKLVKQASDLLPEFAVAKFSTDISINDYAGTNEDKFSALHYTRILAQLAGIVYRRSGRLHIKKSAQKQYKTHGVKAFFLPMLEAVITEYNWGYFDGWDDNIDLRPFWLFMLWRLQSHSSIDQLTEEVCAAFPNLMRHFPEDEYSTPQAQLDMLIQSRFIKRFLQFWGFVTDDQRWFVTKDQAPRKTDIQPLLKHTFQFSIK